jgi:hypothetical protein
MTTVLDKTLRREIAVEGKPYLLTLSPTGFMLLPKGRRKGVEIPWKSIVNGDAALATSLNASLQLTAETTKAPARLARKRKKRT